MSKYDAFPLVFSLEATTKRIPSKKTNPNICWAGHTLSLVLVQKNVCQPCTKTGLSGREGLQHFDPHPLQVWVLEGQPQRLRVLLLGDLVETSKFRKAPQNVPEHCKMVGR